MSALVKLPIKSRLANYIRAVLVEGIEFRATESGMGLELFGRPQILDLKEGEILSENPKANQKVVINLGTMKPHRYQVLMQVNPDLYAVGTAQAPTIIEPGDTREIAIYFKADKAVDPSSLPWLVRLYMID